MSKWIKISLIFIEALTLFGLFFVMGQFLCPLVIQSNSLTALKYDMVYQFDNDEMLDNSYYEVGSVLTYKKGPGFKAEVLMQKPVHYADYSCFSLSQMLERDEILITQNLMDKLNLSEDEYLELYNPIYDQYTQYHIVGTLSTVYGLYENAVDDEFGVVIVGYDDKIPEMTKLKSVIFETDSFRASEAGISLKWSYDKHAVIETLNNRILFNSCALLLALAVLLLVFLVMYYMFGGTRLSRMFVYGANKHIQKKYIFTNYTVWNIIAVVLSGIVYSAFQTIKLGIVQHWMFVVIICSIFGIVCCSSIYRLYMKGKN